MFLILFISFRISLVDKERIVNAYENGENLSHVATFLNMKPRTAFNIVNRYNRIGAISSGKRGGYRKAMISEEIGNSLLQYLDTNYMATLEEMKKFLIEKYQLSPSVATISSILKNKHITHKSLRYSVEEKNSDREKEMRREYVDNYLRCGYMPSQCIYIDETGINLWTQRNFGRSSKGQRIYHKACPRGPNISLVLAISNIGAVHHCRTHNCRTHK